MARTAASYYVKVASFWRGSGARWIGPFETKSQAESAINLAIASPNSQAIWHYHDAKNRMTAIRIFGMFSKSQAERKGMRDERHEDSNVLGTRIPVSTDDLFEMENR